MDNDNEQPTHVPHGDEPISDNWFDAEDDFDDDDAVIIVSRHVAWYCACGEENFTDLPAEYMTCAECGQRYSQYDIGGDDDSYEVTLYKNGDVDHDAFIPDYPDSDEPEPLEEPEQFCPVCSATLFVADDGTRYCEICYEYR